MNKILQGLEIRSQTNKSLLIRFEVPGSTINSAQYWFPKSLIKINRRTLLFSIPQWLWVKIKKTI